MAGFDLLWPLQQQYAAAALIIFTVLQAHYFNFITTAWFHPFI